MKLASSRLLAARMAFVSCSLWIKSGTASRVAGSGALVCGLYELRWRGGRRAAVRTYASMSMELQQQKVGEQVQYVVEVPIGASASLSAGVMLLHERWLKNTQAKQRSGAVQLIADLSSNRLCVGVFGIISAPAGATKSQMVSMLVSGDPLYEQGLYAVAEASVEQWRPVVKQKLGMLFKEGRSVFSFKGIDKPDSRPLRAETRSSHLQYLSESGMPALGGPLLSQADDGPFGSMIIIESASEATALKFFALDPYAKAGLFEYTSVRSLSRVYGAM